MSYFLEFTDKANDDIAAYKKVGNNTVLNKIYALLLELQEHPFMGTGKPEPLRHNLSGCWSRRINREHRLVYEVTDSVIYILSAKGHYK